MNELNRSTNVSRSLPSSQKRFGSGSRGFTLRQSSAKCCFVKPTPPSDSILWGSCPAPSIVESHHTADNRSLSFLEIELHIISTMRALAILTLFFAVVVTVVAAKKTKKKKHKYDTSKYLGMCLSKPKRLSSRRDHNALQWLLQTSGSNSIAVSTTHQHKAACWILHDDPKHLPTGKSFQQRYALSVLYHATQGDKHWQIKTNWMSKKSECEWYGITCNLFGDIIEINLGFNELNGLIPREMALLQKLQEVDMHGNDLQGVLPYAIMHAWKDLKILRLHMNGFFGSLHSEIAHMTSLQELHLFGNYFGGTLPKELGKLKKLQKIDVYANAFEGRIPSELGSLPKLKELDVHDNFFVGKVAPEICARKLPFLVSDCLDGKYKEIVCECCTICCEGLPNMRCYDMKTRKEVIVGQVEQKVNK